MFVLVLAVRERESARANLSQRCCDTRVTAADELPALSWTRVTDADGRSQSACVQSVTVAITVGQLEYQSQTRAVHHINDKLFYRN